MNRKGYLVLEDGTVYEGEAFGAPGPGVGEVVFSTAMTGYQEMLTDPSYAGQILVCTYPLVGNYGVNPRHFESARIQVKGFVVRHWCPTPSYPLASSDLDSFLREQGVPGLAGVDTRALTRRLRTRGVVMGALTTTSPEEALRALRNSPYYGEVDWACQVSTPEPYTWEPKGEPRYHIVVMDCGVKRNILRLLRSRRCRVTALPGTTPAEEILSLRPDGVLYSPGPGDPALLEEVVRNARTLAERVPLMGICLGHQVIALAFGARTFKLKFGHRGANHPVKDLERGTVHITSQNHGYAVDIHSLPPDLLLTHINLNDGTCEGLRHRHLPVMTIQYHSEAAPGPRDNEYMFDRFLEMVSQAKQ